jgi:hypothetical protein
VSASINSDRTLQAASIASQANKRVLYFSLANAFSPVWFGMDMGQALFVKRQSGQEASSNDKGYQFLTCRIIQPRAF